MEELRSWFRWFFGVRWHVVIRCAALMAWIDVKALWLELRLRVLEAQMRYVAAHLSEEE